VQESCPLLLSRLQPLPVPGESNIDVFIAGPEKGLQKHVITQPADVLVQELQEPL
jgi:hypothetical protein